MKRWLTHATIVAYLGALGFGLFAHTFKYKNYSHPAMYFIVWDMFCGWSGYDIRNHMIAEGESGRFYDVSSGPWGDHHGIGPLDRRHYDMQGDHVRQMALNVLKQTDHEPIVRVHVVQETWAKKYNLPESVWNARFDEPKDEYRYYHHWQTFYPNGQIAATNQPFMAHHAQIALLENPRVRQEMRQTRPFIALDPGNRLKRAQPVDGETIRAPQAN